MNKKLSLFNYFHIFSLIVLIIFVSFFFTFSLYKAEIRFENESKILQKAHFEAKKKFLVSEVQRFVSYVKSEKLKLYLQTQKKVQTRVNEAHTLALNLYAKYKNTHSDVQIQAMIIEALRGLRYEDGKGYYFITRMDGIEILFADKPEMEGKSMLHLKNSEGRYVVQGMIDVVNTSKEGFFEYSWTKPFETKNNFTKISYIKLFEPYNWIIGTGLYLDDVEALIKEKISTDRSRLIFDEEGNNYIFIGDWNGVSQTYPAKGKNVFDLVDSNGKKFVQEMIKMAQSGGGFVEYMMPPLSGERTLKKLSYVVGFPDWQWYLGAGVYLDDIEHEIMLLKAKMKNEQKEAVFSFLMLLAFFSVIFGMFYIYFSRIIKREFSTFENFFQSLINKDEVIDSNDFRFKEFADLALHANTMLEAKILINKNLAQYQKIVSSSEDFLALIDRNYVYLAVSGGYVKFFGKSKEKIVGHSMPELYGEEYFKHNLKHLSDRVLRGESFEHEYWVQPLDTPKYLHTKYFPYFENENDQQPIGYVVSSRDITEKKINDDKLFASEKKLAFLAHNDVLTGLPNRILLNDRITHAIAHCNRQDIMLAVCFIDLDNFKKINDSFGHAYGDDVLKQFTARVQEVTRSCDTLSRIGGDEFILLIENIKTKSEIEIIVQKIQSVFEHYFLSNEQKFFLSASIGISVYPDHGLESETLIKNADVAMYKAKEKGKNTYSFFTIEMSIVKKL